MTQTAVLVHHLDELVFVILEDDSPERVWESEAAALESLHGEGWLAVKGPCPVEPDVAGLAEMNLIGYLLERRVQ